MKKPVARKPTKTVRRKSPAKPKVAPAPSNALLAKLVQALDGKKAEHLQVFRVAEQSSITDYLVLATATSDPHLRALRVELEKILDAEKAKILGIDMSKGSGWTVVDAFDVMIHLFTAENREKYRLDLLWKDAAELPVADLLR
jgi:ribosome-associated protein